MIFLWKSCTKKESKPHSNIGKAPRSSYYATSTYVHIDDLCD